MLSGPAILRISVLLLVAGALAALVQFLLPAAPPAPVADPPTVERPSEPAQPPAAAPDQNPADPAQAPQPPPARPAPASPAQRAETPAGPVRLPVDALAFPPTPAAPQAPAPRGEAEVAQAEDTAGPRALAVVDLNTASAADLNRLRGGGSIGRAIVAKRPYASVDQLLTKRVLSRAVYDRIKDQVTVR